MNYIILFYIKSPCKLHEQCCLPILEIEVDEEYEARDKSPGFGKRTDLSEKECEPAANELGFNGRFTTSLMENYPSGCFVSLDSNRIYFNTNSKGSRRGDPGFKSVCKKRDIG